MTNNEEATNISKRAEKMDETQQILNEIGFSYLGDHRVAGMGEPWSMKIDLTQKILRERGIGAILTLTEDDPYGKLHRAAGFIHHHEPIDDCEPPSIRGMDSAIAFIDSCLDRDLGVAAHCFEGRGRAGTILCAWIGIAEALPPEKAIARIHELRPRTVLAPPQRSFLYEYLEARP